MHDFAERVTDIVAAAEQYLWCKLNDRIVFQTQEGRDFWDDKTRVEQVLRSPRAIKLNLCKLFTVRETFVLSVVNKPK